MTRNEILTELVRTHFIENYARRFCGIADLVYYDDIIGELYLIVAELPAQLIIDLYNGCGINCVRRYVAGIIVRQMQSTRSRVYHKYTEHVYHEQATEPKDIKTWEEKR